MKLRHIITHSTIDLFLLIFVPALATAIYNQVQILAPGNTWSGGLITLLALVIIAFILTDLFRTWLRMGKELYPGYVQIADPLNDSYQQIIPTGTYVSALKCAAAEKEKNLTEEEPENLKDRAETLYERVKNIITTTGQIKKLRDDAEITVTESELGALGAHKVSRYLHLSRTNLLPVRMMPFHPFTTAEPAPIWITTAHSPELTEAYDRFKIPHSTYYNFSEHAPGDIPGWLRWLLPDVGLARHTYLSPPVTMNLADPNRPTDAGTPNLNAYPQTAWQETAAYALSLASHAAKWGTPRSVVIDRLDAYTARQNFIVADKVLNAEQIYAWARSELFSGNDAEFTPNPPAVPEIIRSIIPGELVNPGA